MIIENEGAGIRVKVDSLYRENSGTTIRNNVVYSNQSAGIQIRDIIGLDINSNHLWSNGSGVFGEIMEVDDYLFSQDKCSILAKYQASYVCLSKDSSSENGHYTGALLYLDSGDGSPRIVQITSYDGWWEKAGVEPDWDIIPEKGDLYHIVMSPSSAIRIQSGDHTDIHNYGSIHNNSVHDNLGFGIALADHNSGESAIISDNYINNNSFAGIAIGVTSDADNQGSFTIDNSIDANTIRHNGGGIGIKKLADPGNVVISGNEIYDNIDQATGGVGGIGIVDGVSGNISIANNLIYSNIGAIGGLGMTGSNVSFSFVNNQVMNNIGSSLDPSLHNVGGIGFNPEFSI